MTTDERHIWEGSPSQWYNFKTYALCALLIWLIVPIFIALWKFIEVKTWKIKITDQRLIEEKGVLSRVIDQLELYRVKDIRIEQPFFLRLVGLSNVILKTSDRTNAIVMIPAVANGKELRDILRLAVETRRNEKNVREIDLD